MKHQIHYRKELHLFHKREKLCYNLMKVFIEMAKDKGYSRESPVPAMNTRNQILVLMGVTEVISKTEL